MQTIVKMLNIKSGIIKNLIKSPETMAMIKFIAGPAIATLSCPHFWSIKLRGFMGTGFAQPKIGPLPRVRIKVIVGKRKEPTGSKCFKGLNDSLPAYLAVGSPSLYAVNPCAISCKTTEKSKIINEIIVFNIFGNYKLNLVKIQNFGRIVA